MSHTHPHPHRHDSLASHAAPGRAPVLDIGGDIGAVIARLTGGTESGELMACHRGRPSDHFHTGVHLRADGDNVTWTAIFPEVRAGDYSLLTYDGREYSPFAVVGGEVTSLDLRLDGA